MLRVRNLGMPLDMKQRETLARVDDASTRYKIETARDIIHQKNYAIDSPAVEIILKEESLVPAKVSMKSIEDRPVEMLMADVECVLSKAWPARF